MSLPRILMVVLLVLPLAVQADAANIWYVNVLGGPPGGGTSWADPMSLDQALAVAGSGDEIRVAEGTYRPTINHVVASTDPRDQTFLVGKSLTISGGWAGNEAANSEPHGCASQTKLSGDLGVAGLTCDNAYHVLSILNSPGSNVQLSRIKIEAGTATAYLSPCSTALPEIGNSRNCGGGIYIKSRSTVTLNRVIVEGNVSSGLGGGVYAVGANLDIKQCIFNLNWSSSAPEGGGGALYVRAPLSHVVGSVFLWNGNNSERGGAVYSVDTNVDFVNCVFTQNDANGGSGGAVYLAGPSSAQFFNCTFGSNVAATLGAQSIDLSTLTGECILMNCMFHDPIMPSPQHFSATAGVFKAASCYLQIPTGMPSPTDSSPPPNSHPNIYSSSGVVPIYAAGGLSLTTSTSTLILQGGDPVLLPADILDVDTDGNTTESMPMDREGGVRVTPLGTGFTLGMGAYEQTYTNLAYYGSVPCDP